MDLHVFPVPIPPPASLSTRSLWVSPGHQVRTLVSCIQPGLVICFTLDNIHVLMLFSRNIPPSPSPTESKLLNEHIYYEIVKQLPINPLRSLHSFAQVMPHCSGATRAVVHIFIIHPGSKWLMIILCFSRVLEVTQ